MDTENGIVAVGIPPEEGRFCADCKSLVGVRYKKEDAGNWGCGHPENTAWEKADLVTGIKKRIFIRDIRTLRYSDIQDTCGREGKWYEKYEEPVRETRSKTVDTDTPPPEYRPVTAKAGAFAGLKKKISLEDL